jgi:hypothetical protein
MENEKNDSKEETTLVKKVYGSFLKDLIVDIKPVESSGKWKNLLVQGQDMKKDPFLLNKVKRSFQLPLKSARNGGGVKIILDNIDRVLIKKYESKFPEGMTQQEFFEHELGTDLNPALPKEKNFWRMDKRGRVTLTKEGLTLNLNNSMDMFRYLILKGVPSKIAPSYEDRKLKQSYEFMIVNQGRLVSKRVEEAIIKSKAYTLYGEITSSKDDMIGFIKSLGRAVPANYTEDWLKAEVLTVMEGNPAKFVSIIEDPTYEKRIFVQLAVEAGSIKRMSDKRYVLDNGIELGDLLQTINYFSDPEHQELKLRIKSQIELAKK